MQPAPTIRSRKEMRTSSSSLGMPDSRRSAGGNIHMLWLALLAAASDDLPAKLRHLESVASAEAPASSPDGARIAFVTTLFGTRQVATMAADGSYPMQLTDEPGGVLGVRYPPNDPKVLIAIALRADRRRLLFLDEAGPAGGPAPDAPGCRRRAGGGGGGRGPPCARGGGAPGGGGGPAAGVRPPGGSAREGRKFFGGGGPNPAGELIAGRGTALRRGR